MKFIPYALLALGSLASLVVTYLVADVVAACLARVGLFLASPVRRAFRFLKTKAAQRGAASPFLQQLRAELAEAMRDPRSYGNRHTRRAMDSLYFRHRSRGRALVRWDALQQRFVSAARRRRPRLDVARARAEWALHRIHLRRFLSGRKAERRAVNKERRYRVGLRRAAEALDALRVAAEKAGVHFAGLSKVISGAVYHDRVNNRWLRGDDEGRLVLIGEGPKESVFPTQIITGPGKLYAGGQHLGDVQGMTLNVAR